MALLVALLLGLGAILFRLGVIQVKDASAYEALARRQRLHEFVVPAPRGSILDRSGSELAISLPTKGVFADDKLVDDSRVEARIVAQALNLPVKRVRRQLTRIDPRTEAPDRYVVLANDVDPEVAASLMSTLASRGLSGIYLFDESTRYYPAGPLAAQVLGFLRSDGTGAAGVESRYQDLLAGDPGHGVVEEDPRGTSIPQGVNVDVPAVPGDDVVLTIDRAIQYRVQQVLARGVRQNHAKSGTVIVMDAHSGEILAMATYPWFDPNDPSRSGPDQWTNRAVQDVYEPGSVNKVITASAAVQEGVLKLNKRLMIPDQYTLYDRVFHDSHPHPAEKMTLGDIIAYSSNVGAITTASILGKASLARYMSSFGLGRSTGSGLPGESPGIIPALDRWSGTDIGAFPIGQGLAVTPLQMAAVYATIAGGGRWVQPHIVRGTVDPSGHYTAAPPPAFRHVVSPETATAVAGLLAYAVDVGTGTEAQIPGYWVAGKTGTALKPNPAGGYYLHRYVASFIGFAPASRPSVVVAVVIDEPAAAYGGIVAAPIFREITQFVLARLQVGPAPKLPIPPHALAPPRG